MFENSQTHTFILQSWGFIWLNFCHRSTGNFFTICVHDQCIRVLIRVFWHVDNYHLFLFFIKCMLRVISAPSLCHYSQMNIVLFLSLYWYIITITISITKLVLLLFHFYSLLLLVLNSVLIQTCTNNLHIYISCS